MDGGMQWRFTHVADGVSVMVSFLATRQFTT